MLSVSHTVHIDAPPEKVWDVIIDVEGWLRWAKYMRSLERQDQGSFGVGSRVKVTPRGMPGSVWEVTEFEAGHSYTWTTQLAPGLRLTGGHVVEADGVGTKATFSLEASGPLSLPAAPVLSLVFGRNTRLATNGLMAYCERES